MRLTDAQCAEILELCHARSAVGRAFDAAPAEQDSMKGRVKGVAQGGPREWLLKLAALLAELTQHPEWGMMEHGIASAAPGSGAVPPEVPGPRNPTGASSAPKLPGAAADSLDALLPGARAEVPMRRIEDLLPKRKAKPARTLADLVRPIAGRR